MQENKTITLKGGRALGYAEYGKIGGKPLFFFHGWPSSRLHAKFFHIAAKRLGVWLISPDRPGYGLSGPDSKRTLLDWPNDIVELADKLKIRKFAVVGISGGGPYAAACAYKIPNRIIKAGIVVGLAPFQPEINLEGMTFVNKVSWLSYQWFPFLTYVAPLLGWIEAHVMQTNISSLLSAERDREIFTKSFRDKVHKSRREAFKQGITATAKDLQIYTSNWGFNVKDISVPVYLWYAAKDRTVPLSMGNYYASEIRKSKLVVWQNDGHLAHTTHADEVIKALL